MQHLLGRAVWDTDGVRDDLRDHVVSGLGDDDAVLVVDETDDLKKGLHTVGVQRRYTGTAGRVENAQRTVSTYAGYTCTARTRTSTYPSPRTFVGFRLRYLAAARHCYLDDHGIEWIEVVRPTRCQPLHALVLRRGRRFAADGWAWSESSCLR